MKAAVVGALVAVSALAIVGFALGIAAFVKANKNGSSSSSSGSSSTPSTTTSTPPPKTTPGWKAAAKILVDAMNDTADPCDDFFNYACGNWNKNHPIPKGYTSYYTYSWAQDLVYAAINQSLYDIQNTEKSKAMRYTRKIYRKCIEAQTDATDFTADVKAKIEKYGGMPLLDPDMVWVPSTPDTLGKLLRYEMMSPVLAGSVGVDPKNTETHTLTFDAGTLGMYSKEFYLDPKKYAADIEDYKAVIRDLIAILNGTSVAELDESVETFINKTLEFETDVAKMQNQSYPDRRNHSALYHPVTVGELLADYALFWTPYSNSILEETGVSPFSNDTQVVVTSWDYFEDLVGLVGELSPEFTQNYLMMRVALQNGNFLNVTQHKSAMEATKFCSDNILNRLVTTAGRAFVQGSGFSENDRNQFGEETLMIRKAFGNLVSGLKWMSPDSKVNAHFKLGNMAQTIGWPAWIFDEVLLDAYNARFDISHAKNFYEMYANMVAFFSSTSLDQLEKSVNRHDFGQSAALVNAWYNPSLNSITIPAAILFKPQYRVDFPMAFNYGAAGNTPGHEITHGFDDEGVQYDWNGELHTWMDAKSEQGFHDMAECVVEQYGKFCYNIKGQEICINGAQTQGENIADNGGIRASFNAYQKFVAANGGEPPLPGLEHLSMEQIYFLAFGWTWCGSETDENLKQRLFTDPHSPPRDRVIGTLSNFEEFGRAFSCTKGDRMYPKDKCNVWYSP